MGYCKFSDTCTVRRTRTRGKSTDCKQKGELAELVFVLKAASLGLAVCKPYGDSLPFDFVVASAGRLLRVQVKSTFTSKRRGHNIHVGFRGRGMWHRPYTADDIDFIAAYVVAHDVWYIIPVGAIGTRVAIRVYPDGPQKSDGGYFEQYREAWHLLLGTEPAAATPNEHGPTSESTISSDRSENGKSST